MIEFFLLFLLVIVIFICLKREFYIVELEDQNFLYSCRITELEARINELEMRNISAQQVPLRGHM